jgi:hypothetical protein
MTHERDLDQRLKGYKLSSEEMRDAFKNRSKSEHYPDKVAKKLKGMTQQKFEAMSQKKQEDFVKHLIRQLAKASYLNMYYHGAINVDAMMAKVKEVVPAVTNKPLVTTVATKGAEPVSPEATGLGTEVELSMGAAADMDPAELSVLSRGVATPAAGVSPAAAPASTLKDGVSSGANVRELGADAESLSSTNVQDLFVPSAAPALEDFEEYSISSTSANSLTVPLAAQVGIKAENVVGGGKAPISFEALKARMPALGATSSVASDSSELARAEEFFYKPALNRASTPAVGAVHVEVRGRESANSSRAAAPVLRNHKSKLSSTTALSSALLLLTMRSLLTPFLLVSVASFSALTVAVCEGVINNLGNEGKSRSALLGIMFAEIGLYITGYDSLTMLVVSTAVAAIFAFAVGDKPKVENSEEVARRSGVAELGDTDLSMAV